MEEEKTGITLKRLEKFAYNIIVGLFIGLAVITGLFIGLMIYWYLLVIRQSSG